ncbi:MAG: hypothetical protein GY950_26985 [bacterium]|nr:hypothetical protein [bacterium]
MNTYVNKRTITIVGAAATAILLIWLAGFGFGNEAKLSQLLGMKFLGSSFYLGTWFIYIAISTVGFFIPYIVIRFIFKEKLADYGFTLGDTKAGVKWLLAFIPVFILVPLISAKTGTHEYYTYLTDPAWLKPLHIAIHCVSYMGFAFGFEFFFRGFVLFGLNRHMGNTTKSKWVAVFIAACLAALCLIGQPTTFIISAFLSMFVFGFLNFRLGSFVYVMFLHWNIGIWSDIWEIIKLNVAGGNLW